MAGFIHGDARGIAVGPAGGTRTFLHRYEIVDDVLLRWRISERRPAIDDEVRLIDVLVNEDEAGRYINVVRGIIVHEHDLAHIQSLTEMIPWQDFDVGMDLMLAIGKDLGVGPHKHALLRLATLDGKHVE